MSRICHKLEAGHHRICNNIKNPTNSHSRFVPKEQILALEKNATDRCYIKRIVSKGTWNSLMQILLRADASLADNEVLF